MFGSSNNTSKDYNPLSLDEFSDDDDDDDEYDRNNNNTNKNTINTNNKNTNHGVATRPNSSSANGFQDLRQQQQMMIAKQDEGLEMLGQHVEQLGQMSLQIHDELNTQNTMLDDMDSELDQTTQQINYITQKTKDFIVASGGTSNFILILSLIIIAIVLFLLVLYT